MMEIYAGIDVAKKTFDLNFQGQKKVWEFTYNQKGIRKCIKQLTEKKVALVVMEATGGYERELFLALKSADLPVSIINPRRIRDFAKSKGITAKTDAIDARVIADYASLMQPPETGNIDDNTLKLKELVVRRKQLVNMRIMEKNHNEHVFDKTVQRSIKAILKTISKEIDKVEKEIDDTISSIPELKRKAKIIQSVTGIGKTTSAMLIAEMPELGHCNRRQIAALAGTAPMNRDSGKFKGKRMTGGGRKQVRTGLFMPVLTAVRYNEKFKIFYQKLLKNGKIKKVAQVAVMRKMLIILNSMVRKNQMWNEHLSHNLT